MNNEFANFRYSIFHIFVLKFTFESEIGVEIKHIFIFVKPSFFDGMISVSGHIPALESLEIEFVLEHPF